MTRAAFETLGREANIDVALSAVGNHELDCGIGAFSDIYSTGNAEFVCDNLTTNGGPRIRGLIQIELGGWRLAIAGVTTRQTETEAPASERAGVRVSDPLASGGALDELNRLRDQEKVDLAIALVHLFDEEDDALCQRWPSMDLLIGGHSHKRRRAPKGKRPYFVKAQCHAMFLGVVPFDTFAGQLALRDDDSFLVPLSKGTAEDTAIYREFSSNLKGL